MTLLLQDILPEAALPWRYHRAPFSAPCPRAWVSSREALCEPCFVSFFPWIPTDKAVSFPPFPWSPGQSEWRKDLSEPTPGTHEYLMFLAFISLEEQNLFIFDALEGCLVAECCFINALPPRFSSRLPSLSSFLFSSSASFFYKGCFRKGHCPFQIPSLL